MWAPGATLDPGCAPTDANCGITTNVASGTQGQVPYYAADGNLLSATSSMTILANGSTNIATLLPQTAASIVAQNVTTNIFTPTNSNPTNLYNDDSRWTAVGSDGFVRAVFMNQSDSKLVFLRCLDNDCTSQATTTLVTTANYVDEPDILMGTDGFPRIIYITSGTSPQQLHFIKCADANCNPSTIGYVDSIVVADGSSLWSQSFALDANNVPSFAYENYSGVDYLNFARCSDASCTTAATSSLDSDPSNIEYPSMTMDSNNLPMIAYPKGYSTTAVTYLHCTNVSCTSFSTTTVASIVNGGYYTSIAKGTDGFARIAYSDPMGGHYVVCNDINCSAPTVTLFDSANAEVSLKIGSDGYGRIVSAFYPNAGAKYYQCTNNSCSTRNSSTIVVAGEVYPLSMSLGLDGFARIVYPGANRTPLKMTRLLSPDGSLVYGGSNIGSSESIFNQIFGNKVTAKDLWSVGNSDSALHVADTNGNQVFNVNSQTGMTTMASTTVTGLLDVRKLRITAPGLAYPNYYPSVVSYAGYSGTGSTVIHTSISRTSYEMFKIHVGGYHYGGSSAIDFDVVGYVYGPLNGNVDGQPGGVMSYSIVDRGNDGYPKWVGVDAEGKVAIAVGTIDAGQYYKFLTADYWSMNGRDASTGWTIDTNTTTGFDWKDIHPLTPALTQLTSGNVGIGTTTPSYTLSIAGTVGVTGLTSASGAGSLCLSASHEIVYNAGSDNCLPSLRSTKHDINNLTLSGTSTISALTPVSFIYNSDASSTVRYGFIAEDTASIDPHLATYDQAGNLSGVDDRSLISVIVKALRELIAQVSSLAETVSGFAQKFTTNELCVGSTCVTESQLKTILQNSGQQGTPPAAGGDSGGSSNTPVVTATSTITVSQSVNGTISPDTQFDIASDANVSFTITPDTGYDVATLLIDGQSIATSTAYDFTDVTSNHTITATFIALPADEVPADPAASQA